MNKKRSFLLPGVFLLLFGAFTALVCLVDVQPIGPAGSSVGLATLNGYIFDRLGVNEIWYGISEFLGLVALLVVLVFALVGLAQLLRRRSLRRVDVQLLWLGGFYILVALVYCLFEVVVVNYRPILEDGALAASYPSSHTMLVICVMATAKGEFRRLLPGELGVALGWVCRLVMVVTVVARLLSGVHWFTDILGAILLATTLVLLHTRTTPKASCPPLSKKFQKTQKNA